MATGTQVTVRPKKSNQNGREYHSEVPICEQGFIEFFQPLHGADELFSELGPVGGPIARRLMDQSLMEEIEGIAFRPTSITVYKSPTAGWGRIQQLHVEPAIRDAFREALDVDEVSFEPYSTQSIKDLKVRGLERARA